MALKVNNTDRDLFVGLAALFVVSALSYYVDWAGFQGALRWSLILFFMFVKAGAIVWVFMHMKWERLALFWAIMLPTIFIAVFIFIMALEETTPK